MLSGGRRNWVSASATESGAVSRISKIFEVHRQTRYRVVTWENVEEAGR